MKHCLPWPLVCLAMACSAKLPASPTAGGTAREPTEPAAPAAEDPGAPRNGARSKGATPGEAIPSPFRVIVRTQRELLLHGLPQAGFVSADQDLFRIEGDEVTLDEKLTEGLLFDLRDGPWSITALGGDWPNTAHLAVVRLGGTTGQGLLYRWQGQRWVRTRTAAEDETVQGFLGLGNGRVLALLQHTLAFGGRFLQVGGPRLPNVPELSRPERGGDGWCRAHTRIEAMAALPSGQVFVAGPTCDRLADGDEHVGSGVEWWEPGQKKSRFEALPESSSEQQFNAAGFAALGSEQVLLAGELHWQAGSVRVSRPYWARFDGTSWQVMAPPFARTPRKLWGVFGGPAIASEEAGGLWLLEGKEWAPMPLPEAVWAAASKDPPVVQSAWIRGPGDIWVLAGAGSESFLLRTEPESHAGAATSSPSFERRDF